MSNTATVAKDVLQKPKFKNQYENFIGGKWTSPVKGEYFENTSPVDGKSFTKIPRSTAEDIEKAIDVAKEKALLQKDTYVVIYSGELDNYDDTEQKIFSTEFSQDKAQLTN